ncbi:YeiH family protein [Desulfofalx alkaliphila]|uniref:YeiH family protein n=1 Tax=Desulfofalx alkaliphila TaxID=105483 RepID=UPI001EE3FB58|nr:putative sulfate exporter family transporter [Desulfofalx alkaliphila]
MFILGQTQLAKQQTSLVDTVIKSIPGLILVALVGYGAVQADGWMSANAKSVKSALSLNYVFIAILAGMLIRNTVGVPTVFEPGLKYSTIFTKTGIVIMGTKYTWASLVQVGAVSMVFIAVFLFGTVWVLFKFMPKFKLSDKLGGCLAAGFSICGVSATVATGPAIRAKGQEMAYAIAAILIFGLGMLFILPPIGKLIGLTDVEFGAWAGVAIVNSAQVLAAGFAFGEEAGLVAGIYNMGRVVLLPLVVLYIVMHVLGRESKEAGEINKTQFVMDKFPVFVLAFLALMALNTAGAFSPEELKTASKLMDYAFTLGFASIGLTTRFSDMKAAGKDGLILGFMVALIKAVLALAVIKLILPL